MSKLRGACIGAGYFSRFHYDAWIRMSDVEIVGVSDLDPARAAAVSGEHGLDCCFADYRRMFDEVQPDFVDIITPPPSHPELCAEAARRGIHIIVQKPLAPTLQQAEQLVADVAAAGARLMVHENFRFQPWHREIKRQLEAGAIGDQLYSLACRTRTGDGWGEQAYIPRQPYFREYPRLLVYETGVHFIDTFRFLAGEMTQVTAWLRQLNSAIQGEDCGLIVFEFANGAIGQWDANRYNEPPAGVDARFTFGEFLIEGERGSLRLGPDGRLTLQLLGEAEQEIVYQHEHKGFAGDCVYATQRHFIDRLSDGASFETDGEEYLRTLDVQEAIYESAASRRSVAISRR